MSEDTGSPERWRSHDDHILNINRRYVNTLRDQTPKRPVCFDAATLGGLLTDVP